MHVILWFLLSFVRSFAGMTVFALGTFCCTLPHFIFGDELLNANNAFYGGKISDSATSISTSMAPHNSSVADARPDSSHLNLCHISNANGSTFRSDGNIELTLTFFFIGAYRKLINSVDVFSVRRKDFT